MLNLRVKKNGSVNCFTCNIFADSDSKWLPPQAQNSGGGK